MAELEAEIEFWRGMIAEWTRDRDSDDFRRMNDALALAEYKLERLREMNAHTGTGGRVLQ